MPNKLSYEDSCRTLQRQQVIEQGDIPPLPRQSPRYDDEEPLGVNFFRTQLTDATFEHLTLPRTFLSRSEIRGVSFRDADISESTANWNDFIDADFTLADVSRCDFRGCIFRRTQFTGASLRGTDFRHCSFTDCDFAGADVEGAKLTRETAATLRLSSEQKRAIDMQRDDGDEPDGG